MNVRPPAKMTTFAQLEPGDLFMAVVDSSSAFYALKTAPIDNGRSEMVLLGPQLPYDIKESVVVKWDLSGVLSYGHDFTLRLPTNPADWHTGENVRQLLTLAINGEDIFICANGAEHPQQYFGCYVNILTGDFIGRSLPGETLYTSAWELLIPVEYAPPIPVLKFPSTGQA